jgi:hypothetical protein
VCVWGGGVCAYSYIHTYIHTLYMRVCVCGVENLRLCLYTVFPSDDGGFT